MEYFGEDIRKKREEIQRNILKSFGEDVDIEKAVQRRIGDIHPQHPDWVWTEYKPGKFDWRIIKNKPEKQEEKEKQQKQEVQEEKETTKNKRQSDKKKTYKIWDIRPEIDSLTTSKDCIEFIKKKGVVTESSSLPNCDLDSAKSICSTLLNLKEVYDFDPIGIRNGKINKETVMASISGFEIIINPDLFNQFDKKKYYKEITSGYRKKKIDGIRYMEKRIEDTLALNSRADVRKQRDTIIMLETELKRFPRWTMGNINTVVQDITIHEMGHILFYQRTGGRGRDIDDKYLMLNDELEDIFLEYVREDKCISAYSTYNKDEFFAECFVAYVHKDKTLPQYVYDFIDKYFKLTNSKK